MSVPSDYNPNIPQSTDLLSVSQSNILNNFGALQALIDVNHVDFAATGAGKHTFVEMPVQSPVPTTVGGEVGLYCQTSASTSQPEMVFARQAGSSYPSALQLVEFTSTNYNTTGWSRIPSGILLKWRADVGFGGASSVTININSTSPASPNFTTVLAIYVTPIDTAGSWNQVIALKSFSFPNFVVYTTGTPPSSVLFNYLVIGY